MESAATIHAGSSEIERGERSRWSYWRFRHLPGGMGTLRRLLFLPQELQRCHADDGAHQPLQQFRLGARGVRLQLGVRRPDNSFRERWATASAGGSVGSFGGFLSAACTLAMAMTSSYQAILLLQIGNGLGQGCGWTSCLKVMGGWFARKERGTVMAWWGTSYVLGGFLATVFATFAATQVFLLPSMGWRRGFLFPAIVLAGAALWFAIRTRDTPAEASLPAISDAESGDMKDSGDWWQAARTPEVWILAGMYFFLKITRYSLLFWLPLYLVQRMRYSESQAGYTSSLFELVGFSGALIAGYVSDRLLNGRRYPVGATMLFLLAAALLMHPVIGRLGPVAMACSISLLGILIYGPDLLMSGPASVDAVGPRHAARRRELSTASARLGNSFRHMWWR